MAGYGLNNYGYNYNPIPMKTPQQLQQEYSNLMQQYQNIYNSQYTPANVNNMQMQPNTNLGNTSPSIQGAYTKVSGYSEVENAPTPTDGTATLFFDFEHGVFWSKKFANGQHTIQSFTFRPLNQNGDIISNIKEEQVAIKEDPKQVEIPNTNIDLNELYERLSNIENKLGKMTAPKQTATKTSAVNKQKLIDLEG